MRKKLSREDLAEIRKKELSRKELEFQVGRDLKIEDRKREVTEKALEDKNPIILGCINFFGTMFFGYGIFVLLKFGLNRFLFLIPSMFVDTTLIDAFFALFHILIWGMSVIAVIRKKSPFDDLLDRF